MDDLDHSMHIAEDDWTSFCEESEECVLLQPSLACPDNLSLSDSEDSGNSSSVRVTGRQERSPAADSGAAGSGVEAAQINQSGEQHELTTKAGGKSDISLDYPGGNAINTAGAHAKTAARVTEESDDITITMRTEQPNAQSPDGESTERKRDGDVQTESDPLSCHLTARRVNESAAGPVSQDVSRVALRAERERWFVTVSDGPARPRAATSVKKKRRQKKPRKNNRTSRTPGLEKSRERESEMNSESEGERDARAQSNQTSGGGPRAEGSPVRLQSGDISDPSQMSGEELAEELVTITNKHDPSSSSSTSLDPFTPKDPSRFDSVESDGPGDGVEFFSAHSYDSESYLSAAESVEEPQHLLPESSPSLNKSADDQQESPSASDCPSCEGADVASTSFPSAAQSVNKRPDGDSACDKDARRTPSEKHDIHLPASGCSSGDLPSLPSVPDVTLTPCPVADSPETYAIAAGRTRPVYAISAFWDEMEKLTIKDILQLRTDRKQTQETVAPNGDDFPTCHSSPVDTAEYGPSDGALMDTYDTADSDYFTQPDESKPGRSSCEFSSSDFEEEYWPFLGTSRNPSPDPQRPCDSPSSAREEEESTASEGKETPVPSEDFLDGCLDDQDSDASVSSGLARPRWISKSKSVRDIQALNEDLASFGRDESDPILSSCPPLEENVLLKAPDSLGILIAAPFLSNTHIVDELPPMFFPEVFEYFLTEEEARDSRCVAVYSPEDASVRDSTLSTFSGGTSFSFLSDSKSGEEKPIPIFSCSHPTIRGPTFPNYVLLSADCEKEDISPIRLVSRSLIRGGDYPAAPPGFHSWKSLLSIRKICFQDKGSIWCRGSAAWVFPFEAEKTPTRGADPPVTVLTEERISSAPLQLYRETSVQERILEHAQRRAGLFSTLKQADMCLVCIAFSSWVLRSSDPESTDAWKAALLANVSALSAIQYLRHYVKKKNPAQDGP